VIHPDHAEFIGRLEEIPKPAPQRLAVPEAKTRAGDDHGGPSPAPSRSSIL
jgi:hypothetical protein